MKTIRWISAEIDFARWCAVQARNYRLAGYREQASRFLNAAALHRRAGCIAV